MIIKNGIFIFGSPEEATPQECEYCGKMDELRPYGRNGANICFPCGMKPENKAVTDAMFNRLIKNTPALNICLN